VEKSLHQQVFIAMVKALAPLPFSYQLTAPPAVEAVVYHQPESKRFIIMLVNVQELLPAVAVHGTAVGIRMDGKTASQAWVVPERQELPIESKDGYAEIEIDRLEAFKMVCLQYR
jgi:hypothetical protein